MVCDSRFLPVGHGKAWALKGKLLTLLATLLDAKRYRAWDTLAFGSER